MTDEMKMWRCNRCDKWSHAKVPPREHERFVKRLLPGDRVLREIAGGPEELDGYGGYMIACGPFSSWIAHRVEP